MPEEKKRMAEAEEAEVKKGFTRRKFLIGAAAAGSVAAAGLTRVVPAFAADSVTLKVNGKVVTGDVPPQIINGRTMIPARFLAEALSTEVGWEATTKTVTVDSKELAFPYPKKIDPEKARKAGYEGYGLGGCMYGSAYGLVTVLREEVGYPWNNVPLDAFRYGAGGAGKASLCGAMNGSLFVMGLILGKDISKADNNSLSKLNTYYTTTELPLNGKHTAWSTIKESELFTATTTDCRDSRNAWCTKFGYTVGGTEQKQRCAKLTGDVAAQAIELLNAFFGY